MSQQEYKADSATRASDTPLTQLELTHYSIKYVLYSTHSTVVESLQGGLRLQTIYRTVGRRMPPLHYMSLYVRCLPKCVYAERVLLDYIHVSICAHNIQQHIVGVYFMCCLFNATQQNCHTITRDCATGGNTCTTTHQRIPRWSASANTCRNIRLNREMVSVCQRT